MAEVGLLGPVELRDKGTVIGLGPPRHRSVLAVLAMEPGQPVSVEALIGNVWGEQLPRNVRNVLYSYVSRLRRQLRVFETESGGAVLRHAHGGYVLDLDAHQVDLHRARGLAKAARSALDRSEDPRLAADLMAQASALWSASPLLGLDGDWADRTRQGLLQERAALLTDRFDIELRLGRHDAAVGPLATAVLEHPFHEQLAQLWITALYRTGNHAAALDAFTRIRRRLIDDLGIEPGPALQELHRGILRHDPSLGAPPPSTAPPDLRAGEIVSGPEQGPARYAFAVLGPISVHCHGEPVPIRSRMQRRLLAALLSRTGRFVTTDGLAEAMWDGRPPPSARSGLQVHVHRLRRALGDEGLIEHGPAGYRLTTESSELDAARFAELADRGRSAQTAGELDSAVALYDEALRLWRGTAYEGMSTAGLTGDAAQRLNSKRAEVRQRRIEVRLDQDRHHEVIAELTELTETHPYHEQLSALLMLALFRSGRQADAVAVYRTTRTRLSDGLGIDPSPQLQGLHTAVLRGDERLDKITADELEKPLDPPVDEAPVTLNVPRELPGDIAGFTGRTAPMSVLESLLTTRVEAGPAPVAVAVISGTAGVGKTALAIHGSHRAADRFPDGQLFLDLHGYSTATPLRPIEALTALLRALGVPAQQIPMRTEEAAALYRTTLAGRRVLLVLDNASTAEQVYPLLPGGSGCAVVVTSRDRLSTLVAHYGAHRIALDVLDTDEALELLRAALDRDRLEVDSSAVAELVELCARLPLALRISAANLADDPGWSIADYVAELAAGDRLSSLSVDGEDESAVRAAFDLSYRSLPSDVQRLFRLLGLVPGPDFTVGTAAALAGVAVQDATRLLNRLSNAHMVINRGKGRFAFHDLLRAYAADLAEHTESAHERDAAVERLLDWYLRMAEAARLVRYPGFTTLPERPDPIDPPPFHQKDKAGLWLDIELPNLIAIARHASENGPRSVAWRLADVMRGHCWSQGSIEVADIANAGLAAAEAESDLQGQAAAHLCMCLLHSRRGGNYQQALEHGVRAQKLAKESGWQAGQIAAYNNLTVTCARAGWLRKALDYGTIGLHIVTRMGVDTARAREMNSLGIIHYELGELRQAGDCLQESVALAQHGTNDALGLYLGNLSEVCLSLGQLDSAHKHITRALSLEYGHGSRMKDAERHRIAAEVHYAAGRYHAALDHIATAAELVGRGEDRRLEAGIENIRGTVYRRLGDHVSAADCYGRANALAGREERWSRTNALLGLAAVHLDLDEYDIAAERCEEALGHARSVGYGSLEGRATTMLAEIAMRRGDRAEATALALRALERHQDTGLRLGEAQTRLLLARIAGIAGDEAAASEHREQAVALYVGMRIAVPADGDCR